MTLFAGPEYASYIALCRELRLEWEVRTGDVVVWRDGGTPIFWAGASPEPGWTATSPGPGLWIWLPRLDQWLAMLEEAGATSLYWQRLPSNGWYRVYLDPEVRNAGPHGPQPDADLMSGGPTREEAAASLWRAMAEREGRT